MPPRATENTSLLMDVPKESSSALHGSNLPSHGTNLHSHRTKTSILSWFTSLTLWRLLCGFLCAAIAVLYAHHQARESFFLKNGQELTAKQTDSKPSTNSKYTKVQGIGFQIYTGGAPAFLGNSTDGTPRTINDECVGLASYGQVVTETEPEMQCYLGDEDPIKDVKKRLEIMRTAVEKAFDLTVDDPDTLKVFVAPEFFWRGVNGAYIFHDESVEGNKRVCGPLCEILSVLEDMVADARFENWLFLFGSIIASDMLPANDDPYDYLFYNFAPVYKGYDPKKTGFHGKRFLLPKRFVSSSDFLTPSDDLDISAFHELFGDDARQRLSPSTTSTIENPFDLDRKRYDDEIWSSYKGGLNHLGYAMIEYDWLMVDGLAISLEICFDHQMRTALNSYLGDIVTGRTSLIPSSSDNGLEYVRIPPYQAQISVVSSAGMTVTPDSLVLDGLSNATMRKFWSTEGCEQGLQFEGGTEMVQRQTFLTSTDVSFIYDAFEPVKRKVFVHDWEKAVRGSFSAKVYPPLLNVFAPIDIATVSG